MRVVWIDSYTPRNESWNLEEDIDGGILEISSLGHFHSRDRKYIRIVGDLSVSDDCLPIVNRYMAIPVGCVQEVKVLGA